MHLEYAASAVVVSERKTVYLTFYFARSSVPNLNLLTLCEVGEVVESHYLIQSVRASFTSTMEKTNDQIGPKGMRTIHLLG